METGLRHTGNTQRKSSLFRSSSIRSVLVDSCLLRRALAGVFTNSLPTKGTKHTLIDTSVSLCTTLFKLINLERNMQPWMHVMGSSNDQRSSVPTKLLLGEIAALALVSKRAWEGLHAKIQTAAVDLSSCSAAKHTPYFESWLRLQLILLRSWTILWGAWLEHQLSTNVVSVDSAELYSMAKHLWRDYTSGVGGKMMVEIMNACGFHEVMRPDLDHLPEQNLACAQIINIDRAHWERFAFQHLTGKLFPGCNASNCLNMRGFSEAALPTFLCSGCKRARYCSVECQRQAWANRGHRELCSNRTHHTNPNL